MRERIESYIRLWESRCYFGGIPDEVPKEIHDLCPSYKRIAIAILKNDSSLISLGFEAPKSAAYSHLKRIEINGRYCAVRQLTLFKHCMKYSSDGLCGFNSDNHTYRIGDTYLTGVTTFISRFKNAFDSDSIATRYAKKHGLEKDIVLAEWKRKSDESILQGRNIHSIFENYILFGSMPHVSGFVGKSASAVSFINDIFISGRLKPIGAEVVIHNGYLASQIDCICMDKNQNVYILDWKTNSKIKTDSWGKFMLPPFGSLPDCGFSHYSLQLAIYMRLFTDRKIKSAYIVHIQEAGFEFIKPIPIDVPESILQYIPSSK